MTKQGIYWCKECNAPLLEKTCGNCGSKGKYFTKDLKPVFNKERELFENFLSIKLPEVLFRWRNRIMFEGKTLFRFKTDMKNLKLTSVELTNKIKEKINGVSTTNWDDFLCKMKKCNDKILKEKERTAIKFIKETSKKHSEKIKIVSYSGGKDSDVVSFLVKKALGNVPLFFGDTTLEYPETYEYIERFAKKYGFELIKDGNGDFYKSDQDFFELCDKLGPPSIRYRWCCYVFKAFSVGKFYENLNEKALAFSGIRRAESLSRKNYPAIKEAGGKIARQVLVHPIIDWKEADVWFYSLCNNMIFNPLYEIGHMRIGCWPCPNAGPSMCFYRKITHPHLWDKLEKVLKNYAEKMGESNDWIDNGWWRLRTPGRNKEIINPFKVTKKGSNYNLHYRVPLDVYSLEHLKPLGGLQIWRNNGFHEFSIESKNFFINGNVKKNEADLVLACKQQNYLDSKDLFEKLMARAVNCIGCGGCVSSCPNGAMGISDKHLFIDFTKCNHCGKCAKSNCMALKFAKDRIQIKANLFGMEPCMEGQPMNHLTLPDGSIGKKFAKILKMKEIDFEVHEGGKIVCVSNKITKNEIEKLFWDFINQQTKNIIKH